MYQESRILDEFEELNYKVYDTQKYCIFSIPNFSNIPCFAVIVDENKISRISLLEPKYIECEYENYILTKDEIEDVIKILNSSANDNLFKKEYTVWRILLIEQNRELNNEIDNYININEDLSMPDYLKLLEGGNKNG